MCASSDDLSRWREKLFQADHINRANLSLNGEAWEVFRHIDFLIDEAGLPAEIKEQVAEMFTNVSEPEARIPDSQEGFATVVEMASHEQQWAGNLNKSDAKHTSLVSPLPALFRPETRGRKVEGRTAEFTHGRHGETFHVRSKNLTTAHLRVILTLTHIHHKKGFETNETETAFREVLRCIRKSTGGHDIVWLREKLTDIQSCYLTRVDAPGELYGTARGTIDTTNAASPILTWEEHPRGIVVTWNKYFLTQYWQHIYSRIDLDFLWSLPPVAQLIYIFLASQDSDASWFEVRKWQKQLGLKECYKTMKTLREALQTLEKERIVHKVTIEDRRAWILLTRGTNFDLPPFAPDSVKEEAEALILAAKRLRLITETEATPWGAHGQTRFNDIRSRSDLEWEDYPWM